MFELNKIDKAIQKMQAQVESKKLPKARLAEIGGSLNMEFSEYVRFQNLKSLAVANGILSIEEGNTVYRYLGETLEVFNGQPVAIKAVLTKLFSELLLREINNVSR